MGGKTVSDKPAEWYEPEPYWGCPACESRESGLVSHLDDGTPRYRCHECGSFFLGVPGVHFTPAATLRTSR